MGGLTTPLDIRRQDLSISGRNSIAKPSNQTGSQKNVNTQSKFEQREALNFIGLTPPIDHSLSDAPQSTKSNGPRALNPWTIQIQVNSATPAIFGNDGESLGSGPSRIENHIDSVKSHAGSTKEIGIQRFSLKSTDAEKSPVSEAQERAVQSIRGLAKPRSQFSNPLPDIPLYNKTPESYLSIIESKRVLPIVEEDEIHSRTPIVEDDEFQAKSIDPTFPTESIPDYDAHPSPKDTKTRTILNMKNLNGAGFESIWGERYQRSKEMKYFNKKKSLGASTGNLWVTRSSVIDKSMTSEGGISQ